MSCPSKSASRANLSHATDIQNDLLVYVNVSVVVLVLNVTLYFTSTVRVEEPFLGKRDAEPKCVQERNLRIYEKC